MMRAKDIMAAGRVKKHVFPYRNVNEDMPVVNVLPLLLDTPEGLLGVRSGNGFEGVIDRDSLLEGLGRMIAPRDDCSVITLECLPADYSASRIAHAVEDSDAHLVDMWSTPSEDGKIQVTLRVRREDPASTVHSLERYGYDVVSSYGNSDSDSDSELAALRLLELRALLNV